MTASACQLMANNPGSRSQPARLRPLPPPNALTGLQGSGVQAPGLPRLDPRSLIRIRLGDDLLRDALLHDWRGVIDSEVRRYAVRGGPAAELEAEALLALWEGVIHYDPSQHRTSPAQFIHNQIHRRVRSAFRREMGYDRPESLPLEVLAPKAVPDQSFAAAELMSDLDHAILALPQQEQEDVRQYIEMAVRGSGPDEAARAFAERDGTAFAAWKKRLERARRKLRSLL